MVRVSIVKDNILFKNPNASATPNQHPYSSGISLSERRERRERRILCPRSVGKYLQVFYWTRSWNWRGFRALRALPVSVASIQSFKKSPAQFHCLPCRPGQTQRALFIIGTRCRRRRTACMHLFLFIDLSSMHLHWQGTTVRVAILTARQYAISFFWPRFSSLS